MKTLRFHRPLQVVYLEPKSVTNDGIPTVNLDLKVETLTTMAEACDLERKLIQLEEQHRDYRAHTTLSGQGSLAMQLIGHLYAATGQGVVVETAEELVPGLFTDITVSRPEDQHPTTKLRCSNCGHEFTQWVYAKRGLVCPNCALVGSVWAPEEPPKFDVPQIISREWLLSLLADQLGLPVESVTTDQEWCKSPTRWVPSMYKGLAVYHGKSARVGLIRAVIDLAKKARDYLSASPLAIGMTEESSDDGSGEVRSFRVWFKVWTAGPDGRPVD